MQSSGNKEPQLSKCPYNSSHTMPKERLLWHISSGCKDKEMYGHLYATCPHNPFHIVRKQKMDAHLETCQDKKNSIPEGLDITEEELAAALSNQFKPDKNKTQKVEEQDKERIRQNNNNILGYEEDLNQSTSSKKKRIRKKKDKVVEPPKERPAEEKDWYKTSYGDHAQKLLNVEEKKDDEEDDFESMFKAEETAANRQDRPNDNQQLQDNSMYNTQSASLDVSSISFSNHH